MHSFPLSEKNDHTKKKSKSEKSSKKEKKKHKSKEKHKKKDKSKKSERDKEKKEQRLSINQSQYGKYGIVREENFFQKQREFEVYMEEVHKLPGVMSLPKREVC